MRSPFRLPLAALAAASVLAAAGCGNDSEGSPPPAEPRPTAQAADFPAAAGKTVNDLWADAPEGPVLAPSVTHIDTGEKRFAFALFDTARNQISGAQVAVYTARADGTGVKGPYVARSESLAVKPQFQSRTTATDPDSAKSVYVADVPFRKGKQVVTAIANLDGRAFRTNAYSLTVGAKGGPPGVGDRAIKVDTPTIADAGGDLKSISTRNPPARDLHEVSLSDVLGRKPVVITFATPLLCESRVCGPVVDIVEQVKSTAPSDVAFIHQEIYRDNDVSKGARPQVGAWHLPSEPWTFVIDRSGRISDRFEGAFSPGELQRAVAKVG